MDTSMDTPMLSIYSEESMVELIEALSASDANEEEREEMLSEKGEK